MIKTKRQNNKGFTLVELLIAMSLFITVTTISVGAILSVFDANKKAQSSKTVVDNLNLAIEDMVRTVRFGKNYHCGNTGILSDPRDCTDNATGDTFLAVQFDGNTVIYRLCGSAIYKSSSGNPNCSGAGTSAITSPDTIIEHLSFRVFGSAAGDNDQPYVISVIKGTVGSRSTNQTMFSLETVMSQRTLDL